MNKQSRWLAFCSAVVMAPLPLLETAAIGKLELLSTLAIVFTVAAAISWGFWWYVGRTNPTLRSTSSTNRLDLLIASVGAVLGMTTLYLSLLNLQEPDTASYIRRTYILWVIFFSYCIGDQFRRNQILFMIISLLGAIIYTLPIEYSDFREHVLLYLSALFLAIQSVSTRRYVRTDSRTHSERWLKSTHVVACSASLGSIVTVLLVIYGLVTDRLLIGPAPLSGAVLAGFAAILYVAGLLMQALAQTALTAWETAIVRVTGPLFVTLVLVTGCLPEWIVQELSPNSKNFDLYNILGGAMILSGVIGLCLVPKFDEEILVKHNA